MTAQAFKAARDFLFAHQNDYVTAHRDFRWPELEHFNYGLDWFDGELARSQTHDLALKITGEGAATRTFGELSEASNRVEPRSGGPGHRRGHRIRSDRSAVELVQSDRPTDLRFAVARSTSSLGERKSPRGPRLRIHHSSRRDADRVEEFRR